MGDTKVRLILDALDKTGPAFKTALTHLGSLKAAASNVVSSFTSMKAAILGAGASMAFGGLIRQAISYNSTIETSKLGIAAILTSMTEITDAQGNVLQGQEKFNAAGKIAVEAQTELQKIGMTTAATYQELVEVYQGILAPALGAKMTMAETLEITGLLTNAVKSIGLPMNQIKQEARDLIQGGIQPASSSLAMALGITDAMVKKWREGGTLFKELKGRMEGFVYASKEFEGSWAGIWSNFKDVIQKSIGEGMAGFFTSLKSTINSITNALVDIKRDGKGVIESITVKPEIIAGFRSLAYILQDMVVAAKEVMGWLGKIPGAGALKGLMGSWNAMHQENAIKAGVQGVQIPKLRMEDLEKLSASGYSPEQIAQAIAGGKIKIGEQSTNWKIPGVFGVVQGGAMEYDDADLKAFFDKQTSAAGMKVKAKPGTGEDKEKAAKKLLEMQSTIAKLLGMERELVEIEAKRFLDEGMDKKLVAQWKEISLVKIESEEKEKLREATDKGAAKDIEDAQKRIELDEKILAIEDELYERREKLQIERGELSNEEAINAQFDRKIISLEKTKATLQTIVNKGLEENEGSEKLREIQAQILEIQLKINKATGERTALLEENADAMRKQAMTEMGPHAKGFGAFQEEELRKKTVQWRQAGMLQEEIDGRVNEERKRNAITANQFILENATTFGEAFDAMMALRALNAKNAFQDMAETVAGIFDELGATIGDALGDLMTGKLKSLKDYMNQFLNSISRMIAKSLGDDFQKLFSGLTGGGSSGGGGGFGGILGRLFGGGSCPGGAGLYDPDAGAWGDAYHRGGWVPRMHAGGIGPDEYRAVLQKGEFVVSKKGVEFLNKINKGEGMGGGGKAPVVNNVTNNIQAMDSQSFGQFMMKNRSSAANAMGTASRDRHPAARRR